MKKLIIRKFLTHLKALDLFHVYWRALEVTSPELKETLIKEKKSVMKFRKRFLVSKISQMIKPKSWKGPFQSRHDGLCLWCGTDWMERYLCSICEELSFEFFCNMDCEGNTIVEQNIIDTLYYGYEQFHNKFYSLRSSKTCVFFEVFASLVLSGIDPFDRKVMVMYKGLGIHDIYSYEVFLLKPNH